MNKKNQAFPVRNLLIITGIAWSAVISGCGKQAEEDISRRKTKEPQLIEKTTDNVKDTTLAKSETEPVQTVNADTVENVQKKTEPEIKTAAEKVTSGPVMVNDQNFENVVLQSDIPVLVDFWASWCRPCLMAAPVLEKMSRQYQGQLKICKLNVDEARQTSMKYRIRSIPTLYFFKNGNVVDQMIGITPNYEYDLKKKIESNL